MRTHLVLDMCFLTLSFSVQQPLGGLLRAEATKSLVPPVAVIEPEIAGQSAVPLRWGLKRRGVSPLAQEGVDELLRLAVRPGSVGFRPNGPQIHCAAGLLPFVGAIGGIVNREYTAAGDPLLAEPAHSTS